MREKVAIETVDLEKFNQIINKLKEKTAAKEPRPLVSPFRWVKRDNKKRVDPRFSFSLRSHPP